MTSNGNGNSNAPKSNIGGPTKVSVGAFAIFAGLACTTFFAGMKIREYLRNRQAKTETMSAPEDATRNIALVEMGQYAEVHGCNDSKAYHGEYLVNRMSDEDESIRKLFKEVTSCDTNYVEDDENELSILEFYHIYTNDGGKVLADFLMYDANITEDNELIPNAAPVSFGFDIITSTPQAELFMKEAPEHKTSRFGTDWESRDYYYGLWKKFKGLREFAPEFVL